MNLNEQVSDEELLTRLANRDDGALAAVSGRYLDALHDFALRTSLDPSVAAAAVAAALARAAREAQTAPRLRLAAWLFGLTRDETIDRLRGRGGAGSGELAGSSAENDPRFSRLPDDNPDCGDREMAAWAWQAARAQRPRDFSLLDLSLRRGLSADEIADAASMSQSGIYAVLGRLRGVFEETFTASVLYFRGVSACADLGAIVAPHPQVSPTLRRDVARHSETCPACRQTRRAHTAPAELLAAFESLGASPELHAAVEALLAAPAPDTDPEAERLQGALPFAGAAGTVRAGEVPDDAVGATQESQATELSDGTIAEEAAGAPAGNPLAEAADVPPPRTELSEPEVGVTEPEPLPSAAGRAGRETAFPAPAAPESEDGPAAERQAAEASAGAALASAASTGAEAAVPGAPFGPPPLPARPLRLDQSGFLGGGPPRRPWQSFAGWLGDNGPTRISLAILLAGATVLAAYLGLAIGDSIEGGDNTSPAAGVAALPTRPGGVREIVCGPGPVEVEQGRSELTFDSRVLPGFQISDIGVQPLSPGTIPQSLSVQAQPNLKLVVDALPAPGATPGRVDEYRLVVTFTRASERTVAECTIRVRAPLVTTTPTVAASPSATASPTASPRPAVPATAAPPTSTSAPPTVTNTVAPSSTATRTPTITPTRGQGNVTQVPP